MLGKFVPGLLALIALTTTATAATVPLRIGVQKYGTLVILEARHTLEDRLKSQGVSVEWTEFPAGPQLLEALAVGSLDFGITGEAPPVFAQAAGKTLVYVGVEPPAPHGEAILVPKDSAITKVSELKGKRVALNKGSNVHYLLVQALTQAGLTPKDIIPVYLAPADARAAFESGSVDAWVIWDPYFAAAEQATQARILVDGAGLAPNRQYYLASPTFADAHPEVIRTILDEVDKTDAWAEQHQHETAMLLTKTTGLPVPLLEKALARLSYGSVPLDADAIAGQQKIADTFHDLDLIPRAITIKDIVWTPPHS